MKNVVLYRFPNGEEIVRNDENRSICVKFNAPKMVLSTSMVRGGIQNELDGILTVNCEHLCEACKGKTETPGETMRKRMAAVGMDYDRCAGMVTTGSIKQAIVVSKSDKNLTVTACVITDLSHPKQTEQADENTPIHFPSVNIMLFIGANMPSGVLVNGLQLVTEAKVSALQELGIPNQYFYQSMEPTRYDASILVADPSSDITLYHLGERNPLGTLIGEAVKTAVKEAVFKEYGLDSGEVCSVVHALARYKVTKKQLYTLYKTSHPEVMEEEFEKNWKSVNSHRSAILWASLYAALLDQYKWQHCSAGEAREAGHKIFNLLAEEFGITCPTVWKSQEECPIEALLIVLLACMEARK